MAFSVMSRDKLFEVSSVRSIRWSTRQTWQPAEAGIGGPSVSQVCPDDATKDDASNVPAPSMLSLLDGIFSTFFK
jgi:hypothetical protein